MSERLWDTVQTAKKHYNCDACATWLNSNYGPQDVSVGEWLVVQGAKADGYKILPGRKYRKIVYSDDGILVTYRERLDMSWVKKEMGIE